MCVVKNVYFFFGKKMDVRPLSSFIFHQELSLHFGRYCLQILFSKTLLWFKISTIKIPKKRLLNDPECLERVICIVDDILVHGKTQKEHDERLEAV